MLKLLPWHDDDMLKAEEEDSVTNNVLFGALGQSPPSHRTEWLIHYYSIPGRRDLTMGPWRNEGDARAYAQNLSAKPENFLRVRLLKRRVESWVTAE